jgi:hypothetical protein
MRTFQHKSHLLLLGFFLLLATAVWLIHLTRSPFPEELSSATARNNIQGVPGTSLDLQAREKAADNSFWSKEMLAQACGRTIESFWNSLNASTNNLSLVARFPMGEIILPEWEPPQILPHGILRHHSGEHGHTLPAREWRQRVENLASDGWQADTFEFRHVRFDTDEQGQPSRSHFFFSAHLNRPASSERAILEGDLVVDWATNRSNGIIPLVKRIDASGMEARTRVGQAPFQLILKEKIVPSGRSTYIDPLIVYDLDGDGLSEIIMAASNLVFRRQGQGGYKSEPLCRHPVDDLTTAVIADFDGDGTADFLCANFSGLFLFKGSPQGSFEEPARQVWRATPPLKNAMVLTCGDVDQDGNLDVFIGQYKVPTLGQILRPHYYDANDGWPSHLLLNDGQGNFIDATEFSGLGQKRWRRTYSASLADLNEDGHLDLVVVSDFAGLDLYQNDGHGHFTDVTHLWIPEPHAFGMAHALADFNGDGRLDLLMIGMPSPTVDRLNHLGLWRPYSDEDSLMRPAMAFGNRLYLAQPDGKFELTALSQSIARSGWSWGCSAFDFDNDGFIDVYIANGLESRQSVQDYESEFWLHDIFIDETIDDSTATSYFMDKFSRTRGQGWSYGGYEKNRLYLNQSGQSFLEIAHLAGVALEQDSRNVVADDLDADGRVDLLLTTLEVWPETKQTLQVYKNSLTDSGHWIGFRFREEGRGKSPMGARATIHYHGRSATRQIVTGDSHRSQHANTLHFGLGPAERVDSVEIRWLNGQTLTLSRPAVDCYHEIKIPSQQ